MDSEIARRSILVDTGLKLKVRDRHRSHFATSVGSFSVTNRGCVVKRFCVKFFLGVCLIARSTLLWADLPDAVTFGVVIERGDVGAAKKWLEAGLNPNFIGDRIGTGLMIGAWEGNIEMMEVFLAHGASISFTNRYNEQAIQLAAWKGQKHAVEWLIDHGAGINREGREWNALHYAAFAGHADLVKDLVSWGGDINARTTNGSTVLMMAAREGHENIASYLLEEGADPRARNDASETALIWAMRHNNLKIAKLVSDQQEFAQAAQAEPESFGPAVRSQPMPDDVASLLKQIEAAELASLPSADLKKRFQLALEKHRREKAARATASANMVTGMIVRAKRGAVGQEQVELVYGNAEKADGDDPKAAQKARVAELVRELRLAEIQGRPTEDLRDELYQASEGLAD